MKWIVIFFLTLYGTYHYVSRKFEFHDTLKYARAHKKASWSGDVEYYVGLIYYQRSEYKNAQEAFVALREDHPEDGHIARALIMLGDAAERNQDWDTARSALKEYVEKFPQGKDIALAKTRLEMINYRHGPGNP